MKKILLTIAMMSYFVLSYAQYDKDVFYYRGRMALQDGKYSQAIENFNVLAKLDSTDYWNFFFRGIAKFNLGDLRGAEADFDNALRINPVFTNGYHYRAITLSRFGRYEEALADLDRAMELRPGTPGLFYSRGVTFFLAQRFEEAVADFDRYIRKEPKDPSAFLNRGASMLFLKDTAAALRDYNRAIKLDRFEPEGFIRRGRVYASQGNYDEALEDMTHAIALDSTNTLALFNRALMHYDVQNYRAAVADLDNVLLYEPGNALTLYNRSLIFAQMGEFEKALADIDRVININPGNVLAYFNRASFHMQSGRWKDAVADYTKAIELYPDFAKAYLNRSIAENMLGRNRESKADYRTAQQKVREYRAKNATDEGSFADTTRKYSNLLALDAEFAKKDFNNELLQHRDIDIHLKKLYRFEVGNEDDNVRYALSDKYEDALMQRFASMSPLPVTISNRDSIEALKLSRSIGSILSGDTAASAGNDPLTYSQICFIKGMSEVQAHQYNLALNHFDQAVQHADSDVEKDRYARYYKAFYLMNRGVLRAEMIDFIASIENNVQKLTMDDSGTARARVSDQVERNYDYSEAIADMKAAAELLPAAPYLQFNLGNLYCLSSEPVTSLGYYDKAIGLYPYMGDAYFNRGLVLIYLKDKEKGCIDLSRAGELGVKDAYGVIKKYCKEEENN